MRYLRQLIASRELLAYLTLREVRGRYKRTIFGQLWSLANPVALMVIYTLVFSFILRVQPDKGDPSGLNVFALWLLCGLLPWTFLATVIASGANSLVANAGLIQKVSFNRAVLPLSRVAAAGYNWLFEMAVLAIALSIAGGFVLPWIPLVIGAIVLLTVFAAGLALLFSVANAHFRDTEHFVSIALQLWFYLTPVIYPITLLRGVSAARGGLGGTPITVESVYELNPMVHFTELFRQLLYDNRVPEGIEWAVCAAWAMASFAIGFAVFERNQRNLAELL